MSLRAASEVVVVIIFVCRSPQSYMYSFGEVVSLHLCLGIYVASTFVTHITLSRLATEFQDSTLSSAVDGYGCAFYEESDRDSGQIRLPDY